MIRLLAAGVAVVSMLAVAQDGGAPAARAEFGADTLSASLDGFSRKQLRDDGYQLVRGVVQTVKSPDPKHTVVTLRDGAKTKVVRFTHPAKFPLPVVAKEELEVEVGEVKAGFDRNHSTPYVRVAASGKTLILCNTDGMNTDDPRWRRGERFKDLDAATYVTTAAASFGKERLIIEPDAWFEVSAAGAQWLVWQHHDAIKPDAPPAQRTSRSEACAVRQR